MTQSQNGGVLQIITIILIATMVQSLVIGIHETTHALSCLAVGYEVTELSALHAGCEPEDELSTETKIVAGSSALVNILLGIIIFFILKSKPNLESTWKWFLWLFMLANLSNGFGYLLFSSISGAGDYAKVIAGWEPSTVWQISMFIVGSILWLASVWFALRLLAEIFGGDNNDEIRKRFLSLSIPSYVGALIAVAGAALLNPHGITGLPAVAGLMAVAGTMSPLFWMPFWFATDSFKKTSKHRYNYPK